MKVIFLDVDGVLDIFNPEQHIQDIMKSAVLRLRKIIDKTAAKIVVISNWRYGSSVFAERHKEKDIFQQECDNYPILIEELRKYGMEIYDITPWEDSLNTRSEEIMEYLKRRPEIKSFVILDDCFGDNYSQYQELKQRLVFVDANTALQDGDVEKAIAILETCQA